MDLAALPDPPQTWEEARPLLRSILRPATYASLRRDGEAVAWRQPVSAFANELVAVDFPQARLIVTVENTAQWGVGWREVFAAGRENVAALHPVSTDVSCTEAPAFYDVEQATYISSAILTHGWLAGFGQSEGPRPVAFVPSEDVLLIGSDDPEEGAKFFEVAEKMYCEAERPVSPEGFTVRGGRLVPFDKAGQHPLRSLAVRARTCAAFRQYEEQTEFLKRTYEEDLVAVYVAAAQVIETGHGLASATVWGEGVTYDLPEVDYILFISNNDERFVVPFSVVVDIVGIVPTAAVFPRRYRVSGWPEPALMEYLRLHAVPLNSS